MIGKHKIGALVIVATFLVSAPRAAHADEIDDYVDSAASRLIGAMAKRALHRARRSITLGPFIGVAPSLSLDSNDTDFDVSAGVALLRYKIPVLPSRERIKEILVARARTVFVKRIKAAMTGGAPLSAEDRRRIAKEIWDEVKAEIEGKVRPNRFEKPGFAVRFEVIRRTSAKAWNVQGLVGLGVGPVLALAGLTLALDDGADLVVPMELSIPMLVGKGLRSPVVDFFARFELAVSTPTQHRALLGARFVLDVL